jgi:hypothetical protein
LASCARATRGLRRPSLDARSGKPTRPLSFRRRGFVRCSLDGRGGINYGRRPKREGGKVRQRPSAGLADPVPRTPSSMSLAPCLSPLAFAILRGMSIRQGGGDWEPMLLGIEPRNCKVCKEGLYRNKTLFSGGWSRCSLCEEFVHYSCLASGKVSFLKVRPRVCKTCRAAQAGTPSPSPKAATPVAVGS